MAKTYPDENDVRGFKRIWIDDTVELDAPLAEVHALLSDVDGWPHWSPGVRDVRRRGGALRVGSPFVLVIEVAPVPVPLGLPCRVYALDAGRIEWGGGAAGSKIRHRFELTSLDGGRTRLRHVEYATNLLALLALPAEKFARAHDLRWSQAIVDRFKRR